MVLCAEATIQTQGRTYHRPRKNALIQESFFSGNPPANLNCLRSVMETIAPGFPSRFGA
jgi:hypothetical protein